MNMAHQPYCTALHVFLRRLKEIGAVKIETGPEKGFRLKRHQFEPAAALSPLYINLRAKGHKDGMLDLQDINTVARFFYLYIGRNDLRPEGLAGVPQAGVPFADALHGVIYHADRVALPLLQLQKFGEGERRLIGPLARTQGLPRKSPVLLVDDLLTYAHSKAEAIARLREAGYIVKDCLVFLDREQGGVRELEKLGVRLHSIVTMTSMLLVYQDAGLISAHDARAIGEYLKAG